jgi:hypothetical protein
MSTPSRFGIDDPTRLVAYSPGPNYQRECGSFTPIQDAFTISSESRSVMRRWSEELGSRSLYHQFRDALGSDALDAIDILKIDVRCLQNAIKVLSKSQSHSYPFEHNRDYVYVYRGIRVSSDDIILKNYTVGDTFLWPNFTATTKNRRVADTFSQGGWVFVIEVCQCGSGLPLFADISEYSTYPEEEEVLFAPYSGFTVKEISTTYRMVRLYPEGYALPWAQSDHSQQLQNKQLQIDDSYWCYGAGVGGC